MKDDHIDSVRIDIGGQTRRVKLGLKAFRLAAKHHGVRLTIGQLQDVNVLTIDMLAVLLWIGLLPDNPQLEEDTVLDWLDDMDDADVIDAVTRGLSGMKTKKKPVPKAATRRRTKPKAA